MNLYELTNKYQELLNYLQSVDVTDEEQAESFKNTLESLDGAIEDKAENIVHVLQQLKYDEESVNKEISRLQAKKRALNNNQRNLKDYLKDTMEFTGKTKIKSPLFSIWVQKNRPSVIVEDIDKIPKEFIREKTTTSVDKTELAKVLADQKIAGARLETTTGVRFR